MQTIFLIASDKNNPVSENHLYRIFSLLGIDKGSLCTKWIEKEKAIVSILPETFFGGRDKKSSLFSVIDRIEKELAAEKIDFFLLDEKELSPKKLLLCDMDSTIVAGETLGKISHSIQRLIESANMSVVKRFVGHGIGKKLHEQPQVPNFGSEYMGPKLEAGMVIAIEPIATLGEPEVLVLNDGWTSVTKDGALSAHFEHTVAITEEGPRILTSTCQAG